MSKYVGPLWLQVVLCAGGLLENLSLGLTLYVISEDTGNELVQVYLELFL